MTRNLRKSVKNSLIARSPLLRAVATLMCPPRIIILVSMRNPGADL